MSARQGVFVSRRSACRPCRPRNPSRCSTYRSASTKHRPDSFLLFQAFLRTRLPRDPGFHHRDERRDELVTTDARQRLATLSVDERNALAQRLFSRRSAAVSASTTSIPRRAAGDGLFPLSFAQQRFWFLNQLAPLNTAYTVGEMNTLRGPLDVPALRRAFDAVVRRHEILRTTFQTVDGRPMQRISTSLDIALEYEDLRTAAEPAAELKGRIAQTWLQGWDLETGPLLRARLWRVADDEHLLLILVHHIISDGWSKAVMVRELTEAYAAFSRNRDHALPALPIQYSDFAEWQHQWMASEDAGRQLEFWKRHLADPPVLQLASDRAAGAASAGTHHWIVIPEDLTQAVRALSQREGVTLFMTLLAAFGLLLTRYAAQQEVVVGTPTANRTRPELEGLIGCFMNPVPIRVDGRGNPTFRQLLARVREACLGVFANQDVPFDALVRALQPKRDASTPPLFQAMLLLHNFWKSMDLSAAELTSGAYRVERGLLESLDGWKGPGDLVYPVAVEVIELGPVLLACFEYSNQFATTLAGMPGHFQTLLASLAADPARPILELPTLTAAERRLLLSEWNHTRRDYPPVCAHRLFEAQVRRAPDAIAIVMGNERVTYAQLNTRANRLARRLRAMGAGPESRIGILLDRSPRMYEAILAVMKAGGAYVPLDAAYPAERLAFVLQNAGIRVLIAERGLGTVVEGLAAAAGDAPPPLVWIDADGPAAGLDEQDLEGGADTANLAYVIYTSGSTGRPKGTMVTHASLANAYHAWEEVYDLLNGPRRHLQMASLSFDVFSGDLVRGLCSGGTLVIAPHDMLFSPDQLYALMMRERVDAAEFVPVVMRDVFAYLEQTGQDLSFLRLLAVGSDTWYGHEYQKARRFCGPRTQVVNSYGLTESTIDSTWFEGEAVQADAPVPLGRAFPNTDLYVLDAAGHPAAVGVPAELYVGGAGLARGYLDAPDLTAERFVPHPFSETPGARLYRSGDLARYLPDGNIEFLGRIDQQVKLRGFRIEPGEIEAVLASDDTVARAVVTIREDRPGDKRLVAYVVAAPGAATNAADLRRLAKERLPEHMVPSAIVALDELPLTPNGKIDRGALPAPDGSRQSDDAYVAPATEAERRVAAIWGEVLGLEQVGAGDNFFDLGGHSMLAVKVASRLGRAFAIDVPVRAIFETRTLADLAARVEMLGLVAAGASASSSLDEMEDEVVL